MPGSTDVHETWITAADWMDEFLGYEDLEIAPPRLNDPAIFDALQEWIRREAARAPFVLVVEDLQWADAGQLEDLLSGPEPPRLLVVGDITCDVDGSLACTVRDTEPGDPVYVYDPATREGTSGFAGPGLAVMAVGNLPCELPREASEAFSEALARAGANVVLAALKVISGTRDEPSKKLILNHNPRSPSMSP